MKKETVLVTGGSGFLGIHTLLQLLQSGYTVKTTLRSLVKKEIILNALKEGGVSAMESLTFYEADLVSDEGWEEAVSGCDYVLHVASPFPASEPDDEMELILPAREGALRVLRAAQQAGVKRVVLTSSFAAVGYSPKADGHVFTEADWTNPDDPIQAYIKSKTLAEKAAWDFIEGAGGEMELTVINPVGIFGPVLGGISSASLDMVIKGIMSGDIKESPDFTMGVVDVRDVAALHLKAMLAPEAAGERFIATADEIVSFYDVAQLIKKRRPEKAGLVAEMKPTGKKFYKPISNAKAISILNWQPRTAEQVLLASVDSI